MNSMIRTLFGALLFLGTTSISQADVILQDTTGHNISFSSLKGKWVLINYWASWCKTCIEEIPEFNRFFLKHENDSVALFGVNYDSLPLNKQNSLIKQLNIQYPSLSTNPAFALGLGDITGVPVTFVINPQGELVNTLYGGQDIRALEAAIALK
jgi:peroxiredoxin